MKVLVYGIQVDITPGVNNPLYWTLGALLGSGFVVKVLGWMVGRARLAKKRVIKRQQREEALKTLKGRVEAYGLHPTDKKNILSYDFETLRIKLKSGDLKPTDVLIAYQDKALDVHEETNCLVEPLLEANDIAQELTKSGKKEGLLYGIPVSIKDNYGIKGYDCSVGCSNWIGRPWAEDSTVVKLLKAEGAIPFVKTNVPQTMVSYETTNPIYGGTRNPQDLTRGVGGSSGGEAALIAAGGSLLGFGSDIGGSIRIPSSMCGIYGIKPTSRRISSSGTHPLFKGQTNLRSCYGPLANDVSSLATAMQVLCSPQAFQLQPTTPPLPFDFDTFAGKGKLRIGYFTNLTYFKAVPAMERGVLEAKSILEGLGHELVSWDFPADSRDIVKQWGSCLVGDGGQHLAELLKNDSTDSAVQSLMPLILLPSFLKTILSIILRPIEPNAAMMLDLSRGLKGVNAWWELNKHTDNTCSTVIKKWKEERLDAVICPAFSCLPLPFGDSAYASGATVYTMVFNMLDFAAGSLPVTRVTNDDVVKMANYPRKDIWHRTVKKGMVGTEGLAVNVQVVTLPWKEELCLNIMKQIENAAKFK